MPRAKPAAPSRKRQLEDTEASEEAPNLSAADLIERTEVENVRARIAATRPIDTSEDGGVNGLVHLSSLPAEDFLALQALHDLIKVRVSCMTGWGGIDDSTGRKRAYGYFASAGTKDESSATMSLAAAHFERSHVMKEYSGERAAADRAANKRASVWLDASDLPPTLHDVLQRLTDTLRPLLPMRYRAFMVPSQLVAAQPNIHNGRAFLRPHLDEPLNDGFGVIIVTVAIGGAAKILLRPNNRTTDEKWFRLEQGEAYALSGDARNAWLHGVLAEEGSEARESLNLRFGLHDADPEAEFSARREVERHWAPGADALASP